MATHASIRAWRIPMDTGAWYATVHRVTQSWTRLKNLASTNIYSEILHAKIYATPFLDWKKKKIKDIPYTPLYSCAKHGFLNTEGNWQILINNS